MLVIIGIYNLVDSIIEPKDLTFTNNINVPYTIILIILTLIMSIQLIVFLLQIAKNKTLEQLKRIPAGIGCAIITLLLSVSLCYLPMFLAFGYEPEHFVTKDGKQMVACVNSFLKVKVEYYDYENPFIRGNQLRLEENYGNGGYDPFEQDKMPLVKNAIYF